MSRAALEQFVNELRNLPESDQGSVPVVSVGSCLV